MAAVSTQLNNFIPSAFAPTKPSQGAWLLRLRAWFRDMRYPETDREIGRFIEERGGRMTDDLERQIARMSL